MCTLDFFIGCFTQHLALCTVAAQDYEYIDLHLIKENLIDDLGSWLEQCSEGLFAWSSQLGQQALVRLHQIGNSIHAEPSEALIAYVKQLNTAVYTTMERLPTNISTAN